MFGWAENSFYFRASRGGLKGFQRPEAVADRRGDWGPLKMISFNLSNALVQLFA